MDFQNRLKELRLKKGYSQIDLSKDLNISNVTLSQYENGVRKPDLETLKQIAIYFNVSTDYLLGNSNHPQLSEKEEINIQLELDNMKKQLEDGTLQMNLDGEEIDDEIKEFILENMENTLTLAKIKAKEKFTPKKYRK